MKKLSVFVVALICTGFSQALYAQHSFSNCSAAFISNKMVVNEYSDKGKCAISTKASGLLTVSTVNLSPKENKAVDPLSFKVAIRDKNTGTLTMFSDVKYKQVEVKEVMSKCKKGDKIVLLTLDPQFALPHNEILID